MMEQGGGLGVASTSETKDRSGIVVGILLLIIAGILWHDAVNLGRVAAYGIGPAMMPKVVGSGLALLGIASIITGLRAGAIELETVDWKAIAMIVGGFLALTLFLGIGAGFIPAMTVLFVATCLAFGRRAILVDTALGAVLAFGIYLLFSKLLSLSLPQGPLELLLG